MGFWTAIVALAAIGMIGLVLIARATSRQDNGADERLAALEDRFERLDADIRHRVEVLERIITDGKAGLKRQFDDLER
ncbi:hypothetical protein F3N42_13890 [Marinihelvus fidelis]|uniref:Uncharacterized protein n=1 Tax=Marinihelvus fidelis TaxID=2613842 RepID=A0A5N0T989_9GAMM|nr:hypothetical protein [Marinihelvus fidelis]KAA9129869.1 hypothetical protein F3N42_13890 [Marinihelvus fidelis]